MKKIKEPLVLAKNDYEIIMGYLKGGYARDRYNQKEADALEAELKKAKLYQENKLPADTVRLNSTVVIKDEKENKTMELMVVIPEKADVKQKKISILSPIGTALIGFRKGQKVNWKVPAGPRTFSILDVSNAFQ